MVKIYAADLQLELGPKILASLCLIEDSGRRVARRCNGNLETELNEFRNHVADYLGTTTRDELRKPENQAYFNNRLLNTADFFRLSPPILDALVNSVNVRKRAVEVMAQAMADFFLEIAFMGLESLRGKKVKGGGGAVTKEMAEKGVKEAGEKNVKAALSTFSDRVAKLCEDTGQAIAQLTEELQVLGPKIDKLREKLGRMKAWEAQARKQGKTIPREHLVSCATKLEELSRLEVEATKRQGALICKQNAQGALKNAREKLAALTGEAGDSASQKWLELFGPDGDGGELIKRAREQCQNELREAAAAKARSLQELRWQFPELTPQSGLSGIIDQLDEAVEEMQKTDAFDKIWFDIQKNYTSQTWQNAMSQARSEDERQKRQLGISSWWDTLWSWWDTIRNAAYNLVVYAFGILTGLVSVVIAIITTALGYIGAVAMWVFGNVAEFVDGLDLFSGTTFLGTSYRKSGEDVAERFGVTAEFFSGIGQKQAIQDILSKVDPDNLPDSVATPDKGARSGFKEEAGSVLKEQAARDQGQQKKEIFDFVIRQCQSALLPARITQVMPTFTRGQLTAANDATKYVVERMGEYNKQFELGNGGFFEFVGSVVRTSLDLKFSWPELANYFQLIGSQLTLLGRIVTAGLVFTVAGAPVVPLILTVLECVDIIMAGGRVFISVVCTMPCVNAFAYDLVAVHALAFDSLIEGNRALPDPECSTFGVQANS